MRLRRSPHPALHLLAGSLLIAPIADAAAARVTFDRLTWAPDGSALAAEALLVASPTVAIDTLVIDLTQGAVTERHPRPRLFALDPSGTRLAVAGRYTLLSGPADAPERLQVLSSLDPTRRVAERLAFTTAGDTLLLLTGERTAARYELTARHRDGGREVSLGSFGSLEAAERAFEDRRGPGEPTRVRPNPFSHLYQPMGARLYHLERSDVMVPGVATAWLFNLFHRDFATGVSKVLATQIGTNEALVSPDSNWIAVAGHRAIPDYGGSLHATLWIGSADGNVFFSALPEGTRGERPVDVQAFAWIGSELWYTTSDGLFRLAPEAGRARRVPIGPAPPDWTRRLEPAAQVWSLLARTAYSDTLPAVLEREELRREGWPAWVAAWGGDRYRMAIGQEPTEAALATLRDRLEAAGITGLAAARLDAAAAGIPFPFAAVRSPADFREAYLVSVGAPGAHAGEIWLTERHGERQIRLLRAMSAGGGVAPR
jgi:hypothetical protein